MTTRMGYWLDMERRYATLDADYMESEWWALQQLHSKGLLYKGLKVLPFCPQTGATYSSHELEQPGGYKEVEHRSAYVLFDLLPAGDGVGDGWATWSGVQLLVWTTTPWSLFGNEALAVNPEAR